MCLSEHFTTSKSLKCPTVITGSSYVHVTTGLTYYGGSTVMETQPMSEGVAEVGTGHVVMYTGDKRDY